MKTDNQTLNNSTNQSTNDVDYPIKLVDNSYRKLENGICDKFINAFSECLLNHHYESDVNFPPFPLFSDYFDLRTCLKKNSGKNTQVLIDRTAFDVKFTYESDYMGGIEFTTYSNYISHYGSNINVKLIKNNDQNNKIKNQTEFEFLVDKKWH